MIRSSGKFELLDEKRGAFFITAINIIGCVIAGNIVQLVPNRCVMHNTHPLNRSGIRSVALNYTNKSCSLVCRWPNELSQCEYSSKIQTTSTTTQSAAAETSPLLSYHPYATTTTIFLDRNELRLHFVIVPVNVVFRRELCYQRLTHHRPDTSLSITCTIRIAN